jgi:hypothetical protein
MEIAPVSCEYRLISGTEQKNGHLWQQHLPLFRVLLGRGVKTLAQLKAGNLSVTS